MNFYELEESLQPRVFVLSSNENALVIQTTVDQSKIILNNSILTNYYSITAASNLLFQYSSNILTQFSYSNDRAIQLSDLHYLKQLEIQSTSNLVQFSSNAQFYYTNNILRLGFPSSSHIFQVDGNIVSTGTIYASNLQITGDIVILNTITSNTEQVIITNLGSGPALKVTQEGINHIAEFYDDTTLALLVADGGTIGIRTSYPLQTLDVRGSQYISGNLGIGTINPQYPLDIVGDINITGNFIQNGTTSVSSQWITTGSNIYYAYGNVGIGTTNPQSTFVIGNGPFDITSTLMFNSSDDITNIDKLYWTYSKNGSKVGHSSGWSVNHYAGQEGTIDDPTNGSFHFLTGSSVNYIERITVLNNGYVGIGSTQPANRLDVNGNTRFNGSVAINNNNLDTGSGLISTSNLLFNGEDAQPGIKIYWTYYENGSKIGHSNGWNVNHYAGKEGFVESPTNGNFHFYTGGNPNYNERFTILNSGNIGIGSTQPSTRLDVTGGASFKGPLTTNNYSIDVGSGTITASNFTGTATKVGQDLIRGNYLTGTNYNGAVTTTWSVDADSANTASKVVVRDASGNFSAGTITATLNGTATKVSQDLIRGTYLTGTNYNGAGTTTWAVDADSANTASKVVVRDASGNFSAGTITASLTGTATKVSQDLIRGTYLTGTNYNGAGTTTWAVDADSANTASKVVVRDASGNFSAGTITATINGTATKVSQDLIRGTYLTGANYNGAGTTTWAVDATTTATSNKIVARDASGYLYASGVGIGTTTSLQALDVRGTIIGTSLGIGTTAPRTEVDIIGNTLHTGNIGIGTTVAKYPIHVHSSEEVFTVYNGKVGISYGTAISPSTDLEIRNSLDTNYTGILLTNDGNNYPTASLRIESKRHDQSPNIAYAGNMGLYRYNNNTSLSSNIPLGLIHFGGNHTSGSTANKAFSAYLGAITEESFSSASNMRTAIIFAPGSNAYDYYNTSLAYTNEKMRLNSYGNLGIGTTSPITTLDVRGNVLTGKGINGIYDTFIGGPYHKQYGWDTAGTLHTITYPSYCIADNSSGTLHIQVKSATGNKLGNASVSFLKANATTVDLFNVHYHKTTNLTTFTINASTNDITITTDSDCAIAWTSIGSC